MSKVFSERENEVLSILGMKKRNIEFITKELFRNRSKPLDAEIAVANSIRRIIKKCGHHGLKWTLVKTIENKRLTIKRSKV